MSKFDEVRACKEAIKRAKKLVAKINKSVKATEVIKKLSGIKLLGDCPTRWSSTFLLLERLLQVRCHLDTVLDKLKWDNLNAPVEDSGKCDRAFKAICRLYYFKQW